MQLPEVVAVMLNPGNNPEMEAQARKWFSAQTYGPKRLLSFDTSERGRSVGALRNAANGCALEAEILVHWDLDDYSAPTRIAEQVAFLQASGAEAVGYSEMLSWRTWKSRVMCDSFGGNGPDGRVIVDNGEAWLFRSGHPNIALGTSLAYWTRTWERVPFPATLTGRGEDSEWLQRVKCAMQSGVREKGLLPRMIARIHSGNTSNPAYNREEMARNAKLPGVLRQWERAPQFDQICREVLGV